VAWHYLAWLVYLTCEVAQWPTLAVRSSADAVQIHAMNHEKEETAATIIQFVACRGRAEACAPQSRS